MPEFAADAVFGCDPFPATFLAPALCAVALCAVALCATALGATALGAVALCALPVFAAEVTGKWTCQDKDADANVQHIRLQLLDKPDVTITLPSDFDAADWTFLKPILEAYITRLTGPPSKP